jgi:membrane protein DedA with SNARE-associated domain
MQYSRKKFLSALILGRGIRYLIAAYLGARYGRHILRFFDRYQKPALAILIGLAVVGGILSLIQYLRYKNNEAAGANRPTRQNLDPSSPRL